MRPDTLRRVPPFSVTSPFTRIVIGVLAALPVKPKWSLQLRSAVVVASRRKLSKTKTPSGGVASRIASSQLIPQ